VAVGALQREVDLAAGCQAAAVCSGQAGGEGRRTGGLEHIVQTEELREGGAAARTGAGAAVLNQHAIAAGGGNGKLTVRKVGASIATQRGIQGGGKAAHAGADADRAAAIDR